MVSDTDLETMLDVPSNHPSINSVEFYLEAKPTTTDVIDPVACSLALESSSSSSKRPMIQQIPSCQQATGYIALNGSHVMHPPVKIELDIQGVDNNNGWIKDEPYSEFGNGSTDGSGNGDMSDKISGPDGVARVVNLTGDNRYGD
ncbi:unnamed protein product [Arabis nemorensis]|uniref:Uncharacterized protein n=1 Tax=Arabis nemorensis TaxID=586526 RepID=A0A565BED6_9BRAS|nr:unnamed protein product [Arabis nemorensis]